MRNHARQLPVFVENDPIRPGTPTIILFKVAQDGELLVRSGDGEVKALVIVVFVRVLVGTFGLAGEIEFISFGDGVINGGLVVADGAAGFGAGLALEERGAGVLGEQGRRRKASAENDWREGKSGCQGEEESGEDL